MRGRERTGLLVAAVSVAVSLLTVCVPSAASARATAAAAPQGTAWAYGTIRPVAGSGAAVGYAYEANGTFGFAVVLNETNTSATGYVLTVNRTMGAILSVEYCAPNCRHPVGTATVDFHAWESLDATLSLTRAGTVYVGGAPTAAIGLNASSLAISGGVHEATSYQLSGVTERAKNLTVTLAGSSNTTFTPALGIVPLNLTNESWNATSAFSEHGDYAWAISSVLSGAAVLRPHNISLSGRGSLNATGNVSLAGTDSGTTVDLGGSAYQALDFSLSGPFALREGFLLVPSSSDLFGAAPPSWLSENTTNNSGYANVSASSLDVSDRPAVGGHLGFYASGAWWGSRTVNPAISDVTLGSDAGLSPATASAPAAAGPNATYVQGTPESVRQATSDQSCLATGVGCPTVGGPGAPLGRWIALGGAASALVVVLVVLAERRRIPAAPSPNAALYPTVTSSATAPVPPHRPGAPAPPVEDDPLGHLW